MKTRKDKEREVRSDYLRYLRGLFFCGVRNDAPRISYSDV